MLDGSEQIGCSVVDSHLRALHDEGSERLRKGDIPADEDANRPEGRLDDDVVLIFPGRGEVRPLGVPEVLLGVGAEDLAGVGDEGRDVVQDFLVRRGGRDDRARHDVDLERLGQVLVAG